MTRSCLRQIRGFCFCEFCIKECIKNAYVEANNSPKEQINFKNYKESINLTTLEIYCKQFGDKSTDDKLIQLEKPFNLEIDNQTKFLRILSDNFTKSAVKQAKYFIRNIRTNVSDELKSKTRLRSSVSESSSCDQPSKQQPSNTTTHCNSSGTLFNTTGLQINKDEQKNRIKFGPEDFLATTHPMLLFGSNLIADQFYLNKKSNKMRRKSSNKKDQYKLIELCKEDAECKESEIKENKTNSNNVKKLSKNKLSNITNII